MGSIGTTNKGNIQNILPQLPKDEKQIIDEKVRGVEDQLYNAPVKTVSLDNTFYSMQPTLRQESVDYVLSHDVDEPIILIKTDNAYIIGDGNHRMLKATMDGSKTIQARVTTLKQLDNLKKKNKKNKL